MFDTYFGYWGSCKAPPTKTHVSGGTPALNASSKLLWFPPSRRKLTRNVYEQLVPRTNTRVNHVTSAPLAVISLVLANIRGHSARLRSTAYNALTSILLILRVNPPLCRHADSATSRPTRISRNRAIAITALLVHPARTVTDFLR